MRSTKEWFIFQILLMIYGIHISHALQCKTCEKNDYACLLGHDAEVHTCASDNDLCYSWFDRTGSSIGVQRGCISPDMTEYQIIKQITGDRDEECVKRVNGLDCFKICSLDQCN